MLPYAAYVGEQILISVDSKVTKAVIKGKGEGTEFDDDLI